MKKEKRFEQFDVLAANCPSRGVYDQILQRWNILILLRLFESEARFSELRRSIEGISDRMLSKNLKLLESLEIVVRTAESDGHQGVSYELTQSGRNIAEAAGGLIKQIYLELPHLLSPASTR